MESIQTTVWLKSFKMLRRVQETKRYMQSLRLQCQTISECCYEKISKQKMIMIIICLHDYGLTYARNLKKISIWTIVWTHTLFYPLNQNGRGSNINDKVTSHSPVHQNCSFTVRFTSVLIYYYLQNGWLGMTTTKVSHENCHGRWEKRSHTWVVFFKGFTELVSYC